MNQHYTQKALNSLDGQIVIAEQRLSEALLSMGSGAEADSNTWHDNPAFEQAKLDVDQARKQLGNLRTLRKDAVVVEKTDSGIIEVGSTVLIRFGKDEPMKVHIGGHFVVRDATKSDEDATEVSTEAPLGAALLNHQVGDVVTYLSPNNSKMEVTIIELV